MHTQVLRSATSLDQYLIFSVYTIKNQASTTAAELLTFGAQAQATIISYPQNRLSPSIVG